MPLFYMSLSSTLYILEFLVADISPTWIMVDGYSSAGRTGLKSAVLAGFFIGEELPVMGSPLDRLCFLANKSLTSTLSWHSGWHTLFCVDMVDISLSWWEAWYLPPFYMGSSSTLCILEFLVAGVAVDWIVVDGYSSAGWTGLRSAVLAGFVTGLGFAGGWLLLGRRWILTNIG